MTDDPREVLKAAGVECAEVDEYEPGFECDDICESCEWHAPGTDQGPCTTDDPREWPDNCPRRQAADG